MARFAVPSLKRARGRSGATLLALGAVGLCGLSLRPSSAFVGAAAATETEESGSSLATFIASHTLVAAGACMLLSSVVAKQEPPPAPPAAVPLEKRSDLGRLTVLACVYSLISGMVNAIAIITMGGTVAHHTGNASHTGRLLGVDGSRFACLMVAYFVGAAVTGFRKSSGENPLIGKSSPALFGSAVAVAGGGLIHWASGKSLVALPILAFSQGIHNGVTSKLSSMPLRTTHMTGTLTDTGAQVGQWVRAKLYGEAPPPIEKTAALFSTMIAFGAGGVLAKMACDEMGSLSLMIPAAVLAVMATGVLPLASAEKKN